MLRGFIGQSLQAELPGASRGKAGVCNLYTLADVEVEGPFHIWLESGSRVLIGFFGLMSVFDWPESWHLRVHHSAWQRAVDWWMSVPGTYPGLSSGGFSAFSGWRFPVCGQRDLSPVCIHFPTEGYLGSLQVLAIMSKAAIYHCVGGFPGGLVIKNLPANARDMGLIPGSGRSPGGGQGNPLQVFPWKSWWTEKPGRLQSVGLQKSCT